MTEELDISDFTDGFESTENQENSMEKSFSLTYSQKQIGSIAEYIEPISSECTIDVIAEMFRIEPSLQVLPIEEYDAVIGFIDRTTAEESTDTAFKRFMSKEAGKICTRVSTILYAKDYIEKALDKVTKISREYGISYFPVFDRKNFFGIVSLDKFLERISEIREQDLEKASYIQKSLFPSEEELDALGYKVSVWNRMANQLGGDFYHAFKISDDESMICCFDVSGKNVAASLLTIAGISFFKTREQSSDKLTNPVKILSEFDAYLEKIVPVGNFITGAIIYYDKKNNIMKVFNCGHTDIFFLYKKNESDEKPMVASIAPKLPPFGMGEVKRMLELSPKDASKKTKPYIAIKVKHGLHIDLYSDGLTDMQNEDGIRYEEKNTKLFFQDLFSEDVKNIAGKIDRTVNSYIGKAMQPDDITVIDIRI